MEEMNTNGSRRLFLLMGCVLSVFMVQAQEPEQDTTAGGKEKFRYLFKTRDREPRPEMFDTLSLSDFYDMSLEELENIRAAGVPSELESFLNSLLSVSTKKSLPARYNPNIVTLVTEEEIRNSGARDLIDVLRLIPGFHFAQDQQGNIGLGVRGNWANEGKALLMINGNEVNEHYTARLYFGNHYPAEMIRRIEIVRGPGSAIHGGFAEFAVINIVTRKPDEPEDEALSVHFNSGRTAAIHSGGRFGLYAGRQWKNVSLSGFLTTGIRQRSDRLHYGFYSCVADSSLCHDTIGVGEYSTLRNDSELAGVMMGLDFNWGGFSFSNLTDLYRVTDVTSLNRFGKRPLKYGYFTNFTEFKYRIRANHKLTITPSFNINIQTPWEENTPYAKALLDNPARADSLALAIVRAKTGLHFNYDPSHRVNIIAGMESFTDHAENADTVAGLYKNKAPDTYSNTAFYGQAIFRLDRFQLIAGARYEFSSLYKPAFSPRLGFVGKFKRSHFKVLVSDAFRSPTLGNIFYSFDGTYDILPDSSYVYNVGRGLEPEKTLAIEVEYGRQFGENIFITANLFDITTRNPIVYTYYQDKTIREVFGYSSGLLAYQNFDRSGTSGFEVDFQFRDDWGWLGMNYSHYMVSHKPRISAYAVSTFNRDPALRENLNNTALLAFPRHKFNINWCYYIRENFTVNVTGSFLGPRYGYDVDITGPEKWDVDGQLVKERFNNLINVWFRYTDLFTPGLEAGAGVFDIFNRGIRYYQPYFGMQPPLPGPSREVYMKLSYDLPLKKKKKPEKN